MPAVKYRWNNIKFKQLILIVIIITYNFHNMNACSKSEYQDQFVGWSSTYIKVEDDDCQCWRLVTAHLEAFQQ